MITRQSTIDTPKNLSNAARKFFRSVVHEQGFYESSQLAILEIAARAMDTTAAAQKQIDALGLLVNGPNGMLRANPAVRIRDTAQSTFLKCCQQLKLEKYE